MDKVRIGLFGGSFDSVTKAHIYVAEELIHQGVLDYVEFVPAYVSYHGKSYCAHPRDRIDLLWAAIGESKYHEKLSVNTFEIDNKMKTCTYDFVEKYLETVDNDDYQYYFIFGGDNAKKIPNFRSGSHGGKIIDLIPFVVVSRGKDDVSKIEWCSKEPHICVNITDRYHSCSSTNIRKAIRNINEQGLPPEFLRDWICWSVFAYIMEGELYTEIAIMNRNWE